MPDEQYIALYKVEENLKKTLKRLDADIADASTRYAPLTPDESRTLDAARSAIASVVASIKQHRQYLLQ